MDLNDLLKEKGINPSEVLAFRHRPSKPAFNKVLPWLAAEREHLYNGYQETQGLTVANAMKRSKYLASFIGNKPSKALFVGLYTIGVCEELTRQQGNQLPMVVELDRLGETFRVPKEGYDPVFKFDLGLSDVMSEWKGRLVVSWPPPAISWCRRPKGNMPIVAIHETSVLAAARPTWHEVGLTCEEVLVLPSRWQAALEEWRGVYYIFDTANGKGYVGSATGSENIYGRWKTYATNGHGGNVLLKGRDKNNYKFSILQLVSQDTLPKEVIRLEESWKVRLHTYEPYGLNGKASKVKPDQKLTEPTIEDV